MFKSIKIFMAASALASTLGLTAHAAPTLVDPWQSSGNGSIINDNFGGVPDLDLLYSGKDAFGGDAATGRMYVWALWGTLFHVSYTDRSVADVFIRPDVGIDGVSLYSFDIGSYFGDIETSEVRVYNGDYSSLMYQQVYNLEAAPVTISPALSSLNGLHIQFSGTPGYMAIDNILVEAGQAFSTPVPEPSVWVMTILGLGGIGAVMRRRRQSMAMQPA